MKPLKHITLVCLLVTLTACKIDLSIIGLGEVKTDSDGNPPIFNRFQK